MAKKTEKVNKVKEEKKIEEKKPLSSVSSKIVALPAVLTVKELAENLKLQVTDVIKELMKNGVMASINEEIDFETAAIIADDLGVKVKEKKEKDVVTELDKLLEEKDKSNLKRRSPIVTVMGHVDHGKTSLLDAIRETNVTGQEEGGITQHIGAYQVESKGKMITFLDTPGHEAFTAMRARGANVTDIAVLVVAADDGVKPQTIEAINHAKAAEVPIIVAINKIDKDGADPAKVKKELSEHGVITEEWGGENICVEVSAKKKTNLDDLLDMILLVADMQDLKANPKRYAVGNVIESHKTSKGGAVATVLVRTGTLHVGDDFSVGTTFGKIRAMKDYKSKKISEAGPSMPVRLIGLKEVPRVGDFLEVEISSKDARLKSEMRQNLEKLKSMRGLGKFSLNEMARAIQKGKIKKLGVVLKADVDGTLEAVYSSLVGLKSKEVTVDILHKAVGDVNKSDVMMAKASKAFVVGFNVSIEQDAADTAKSEGVSIKIYKIIYELIDDLKKALEGLLAPELVRVPLAKIKVLAVFKRGKTDMIFGGRVIQGKAVKEDDVKVDLIKDKKIVSSGILASLQCEKENVAEVAKGNNAGMKVDGISGVEEGDIVELYREEERKRKLGAE